jgi:hypothetical protein
MVTAVTALGQVAVERIGPPKVVVGGDEPRLTPEDPTSGPHGQAVEELSSELAAVGHQQKEVHGDRQATDEDQDEDVQLSARPFHEAPRGLFCPHDLTAF